MRLQETAEPALAKFLGARKPFGASGLRKSDLPGRNKESGALPGAYTLIDGSDDPVPVGPETLGGSGRNRLMRRRFPASRVPESSDLVVGPEERGGRMYGSFSR